MKLTSLTSTSISSCEDQGSIQLGIPAAVCGTLTNQLVVVTSVGAATTRLRRCPHTGAQPTHCSLPSCLPRHGFRHLCISPSQASQGQTEVAASELAMMRKDARGQVASQGEDKADENCSCWATPSCPWLLISSLSPTWSSFLSRSSMLSF